MVQKRKTGPYNIFIYKHPGVYEDPNNGLTCRSDVGQRLAIKTLTPSALKIYLLLSSKKNTVNIVGITSECQELGINISRATITKAMKDLEEKGFLIRKNNWHYEFYDLPPKEET